MIDTAALVIVVIALVSLLAWVDWNNRKERSKLINALMSRTPEQLRDLEFVDKVQPPKLDKSEPDLVPADQLSDEDFTEMVGLKNG